MNKCCLINKQIGKIDTELLRVIFCSIVQVYKEGNPGITDRSQWPGKNALKVPDKFHKDTLLKTFLSHSIADLLKKSKVMVHFVIKV